MKNIDPSTIPDDEWNKMGLGDQLMTKAGFWLQDQEDRLEDKQVAAKEAGEQFKPSVYDRFVGFVIEVTVGQHAG